MAPKPLDWSPTFNTKDKIPLGLYVLDKEIDSLLGNYVERSKISIDEYFYDGIFADSFLYDYCLLYIHPQMMLNQLQTENVCQFVNEGNICFISSHTLPKNLQDTLNLSVFQSSYSHNNNAKYDTITLEISEGGSIVDSIVSHKAISGSYFLHFDTCETDVLGSVKYGYMKQANFIKTRFGAGYFFIHLEPAVFSNYYLLQKGTYKYAEIALSYIPDYHEVIWSLYNQTSKVISDSPFRFILSQPALRWAWYLLVGGVIVFVIFNLRRSQRVIPTIQYPVNTSVEFARTIGNLYFMDGSISNIMTHKIIYLLEKIRADYHLNTEILDEKFVLSLHLRSGREIKIIERMIFLVNKHQEFDYNCSPDDLTRLNFAIENFYNHK